MNNKEAREIFEKLESEATTPEQLATRQLLKEFFTNPDFKKKFSDWSFKQTQ